MNEIADLVLIAWVPPLFQENLTALEFGLCEQLNPNHGFLFQARWWVETCDIITPQIIIFAIKLKLYVKESFLKVFQV